MKRQIKRIFITITGITLSHLGAAGAACVNIGQGPVSAFCLAVCEWTGIQFGTVLIFFQYAFFAGQILLLKRSFPLNRLMQLLTVALGGLLVNFFLNFIFIGFEIAYYPARVLTGTLFYLLNAAGVSLVLMTNLIGVPLESFLSILSERTKMPLGTLKRIVDCGLILLSILLCLICHLDFTIREGTLINAFVFGGMLEFMKVPTRRLKEKLAI